MASLSGSSSASLQRKFIVPLRRMSLLAILVVERREGGCRKEREVSALRASNALETGAGASRPRPDQPNAFAALRFTLHHHDMEKDRNMEMEHFSERARLATALGPRLFGISGLRSICATQFANLRLSELCSLPSAVLAAVHKRTE